MELPEEFVKSGTAIAKGAYIFGKPLMDCSREELIAVAAHGWDSERRAREGARDTTRQLLGLIRANARPHL